MALLSRVSRDAAIAAPSPSELLHRSQGLSKRLIVCCDGTWNQPTDSPTSQHPTNVFKIAQAIPAQDRHGTPQVVYYARGLGSGFGINRWLGGAFGLGIDQEIQNAYLFLALNYQPGDEVYLFGFSRGAYTVRSLAGLINAAGLLEADQLRQAAQQLDWGLPQSPRNRLEEAYQLYRAQPSAQRSRQAEAFRRRSGNRGRIPIRLLCCWDTVGALGIPRLLPGLSWGNQYRFHDCQLSSIIHHALHAVALDERRKVFDVTPMVRQPGDTHPLEQLLFPGDHGCVGGGSLDKTPFSNGALQWVVAEIQRFGLGLEIHLNPDRLPANPLASLATGDRASTQWLWRLLALFSRDFARQILQVREGGDLAWLSCQTGLSVETLRQGQARLQAEAQAQGSPSEQIQAVYGLHRSLKQRLEFLGRWDAQPSGPTNPGPKNPGPTNLGPTNPGPTNLGTVESAYRPRSLLNYIDRIRAMETPLPLQQSALQCKSLAQL